MKHIYENNIPKELFDFPVILYGGGVSGNIIKNFLSSRGVQIKYIVDDDENLQGEIIGDVEVISYTRLLDLSKEYKNLNIILATLYGKRILTKLAPIGNINIYDCYDELMKEGWYLKTPRDKIEELKHQLSALDLEWGDDESKRVINGIYQYIVTKDLNILVSICTEEEHYFIHEVVAALKQPLEIIDGGAYRGELLQGLKNNNLKVKKWFCFEADGENYDLLIKYSKKNSLTKDQQICINKGLWSGTGKIYFSAGKNAESRVVPYETDNLIETISIDEFIGEGTCNFIKMDIEGSEFPALKGGIKTICRERPVLAISIYHSIEDYWRIPKYLMHELPQYKWYVRHHALVLSETVLYGIPCEL